MTKREFLESLRLALNGKVTSGQLTENLDYYEEYINTEIRKGRQEPEVLAGLGDPRLIARTIVQTGGGSRGEQESFSEYGDSAGYADSGQWQDPEDEYGPGRPSRNRNMPLVTRIPPWVWLIVVLLVAVLILSAIFSVISALLPILLPILIVLFLVKVFRDWLN